MREVQIGEVRAGDVARSNGKEHRMGGDGDFVYGLTPRELAKLGVTFWREERELPDYPGATVLSSGGRRCAVRACDWGESFVSWLTTSDSVPWKTDPELLDWLGPNWQEMTTPPAREWVPVDAGQVREGDFVRFEWADGDAVEGFVTVEGNEIQFGAFVVMADEPGKWFKREEQTGERG